MKLRLPVVLAPVGSLESFHPGGAATAGARRGGVRRADHRQFGDQAGAGGDRRAHADGPKIFQLYVRGDDAWVDDVVHRAIDAGYRRVLHHRRHRVLFSRRERDIAGRFVKPWRAGATGHEFQAGVRLGQRAALQGQARIPLILKGIATAEDAAHGLRARRGVVYVSNHGGRQLDHGRGAMDVLPEVVEAVARPRAG